MLTCGGHAACECPSPALWVVEFRGRDDVVPIVTACNKRLPVRQQGRFVKTSSMSKVTGCRPGSSCRIVQFRLLLSENSSGNQHLAIWQQRRAVLDALVQEVTRRGPGSAYRVINFRLVNNPIPAVTAGDQDFSIG